MRRTASSSSAISSLRLFEAPVHHSVPVPVSDEFIFYSPGPHTRCVIQLTYFMISLHDSRLLLEYPRRPRHTRDIMTTYDKELVYIRCTRSKIQLRVVSMIFRATLRATFQQVMSLAKPQANERNETK